MPGLTTRTTTQISIYKPSFNPQTKHPAFIFSEYPRHVRAAKRNLLYHNIQLHWLLTDGCLIKLIIGSEYHWAVVHLQQISHIFQINPFFPCLLQGGSPPAPIVINGAMGTFRNDIIPWVSLRVFVSPL